VLKWVEIPYSVIENIMLLNQQLVAFFPAKGFGKHRLSPYYDK